MNTKMTTLMIATIVTISMTGSVTATDGEYSLGYIAPPHSPGSEGILIDLTSNGDPDTEISDSPNGFFSSLITQEIANLYGRRYLDGDRSISTIWMINQLDEKYNIQPKVYIG